MNQNLAAFDFDGTITKKDTFIEIIKYYGGIKKFLFTLLVFSPLLLLLKFHLYPNWKIKQKIFSYYFKGMQFSDFMQLCKSFAEKYYGSIIYEEAKHQIEEHLSNDDKVVIISASIDAWVKVFASKLGVTNVIATEIETDYNGVITGNFLTKNCYGKEKVKRLRNKYPNLSTYHIIGYGDSKGDRDLLTICQESHYRPFNK